MMNSSSNLSFQQPTPAMKESDGVFKVPLPIRPSAQIRNLCNVFKQKQIALIQEKKEQYAQYLKLAAIRNAIIQQQRREMME